MMKRRFGVLLPALALAASATARADAVDRLREFSREVTSAQASFTQTVTSADGRKRKVSSGSFAFQRPGRFRFAYEKPFEQLIVADGQKVWIYDADLNQASARPLAKALGATPAALLAGAAPESEFALTDEGTKDGLAWVRASPKGKDAKEAALQSIRVGFRGKELAAVEVTDNFGQRSLLQFEKFSANVALPAERFRFTPPAGADVVEQ
jgi:outer membrane lipoprotein carrier protein